MTTEAANDDPPFDGGKKTGPRTPLKHRVTVMKDHSLEFPQMFQEIHIVSDSVWERAQFAELFTRSGCTRAKSLEEADIVVFTGGPDVDPVLYGERPHSRTSISPARDRHDMQQYVICQDKGIPMVGVCRGAQFLHVMNGGKLYQHIDGHQGDHSMLDLRDNTWIDRVSSVHHQAVRRFPESGMEILATAGQSRERWLDAEIKSTGPHADIEAFFYRDTCCFGVQGHPEYRGYNQFACWFMNKIEQYIVQNPDLVRIDGFIRIKPELVRERAAKAAEQKKIAKGKR